MSKYTTEVRYVCQTYAQTFLPANTWLTIDETIDKAIPFIFSDDWNTYNPDHKNELCKKILKHYYMREIGMETVALWELEMNEYLAEIMPKYNVLYANLEKVKTRLMENADTTETRELTGNQKTKADSNSIDHTASNSSQKSTSDSTTNGNGDGSSDGWQESNDTPQGGLDGIESRKYLSNAVHNRGTTTNTTSQSANANGTTNATNDSNTTSEGHSTGSSDTTENYTLKITGKNNGNSYIDEFLKIQKEYNDIDASIINDLNICFINLWE